MSKPTLTSSVSSILRVLASSAGGPGFIPSQGPRHTKDVITMVPVVPLFSTEHSKGKILALSQELRINVMDKNWDRKSFEVGGHWPLWRG